MAARYDMEGSAATLDDALQVVEQFLEGRVHVDLLVTTITDVVTHDATASHRIREKIDDALRASELAEPVWERITAAITTAASSASATEWSDDDATSPQPLEEAVAAGMVIAQELDDTGPPLLDDRVEELPDEDEDQAVDMPPGTLLGDRYVIVSQAHTGGMGKVYKALDRAKKEAGDPDPWVAIKVIGRSVARHPQAIAALEREAENCKSLQHDNIVRVFGFERDGENCFITMEWLEGESLVQLLERSRSKSPSATQVRRIVLGLGAALAHAHSRGVTHADVKPGNVFVTRDSAVKLLDFGVALAESGEATRDVDARTPAYSSCEVLEGQTPEPSDDVFSFSLLIYRMLAGKPAYGASNALEAESSQVVPERVTSLAEQAWHALRNGLAFRRAERPADVVSFLEAFTAPPPETSTTSTSASLSPSTDSQAVEAPVTPAAEPAAAERTAALETQAPTPDQTSALVANDLDADADTSIAPLDTEEFDESSARWVRPALIAASVLACATAGLWFWNSEPETLPVAASPRTPAADKAVPPSRPRQDELEPVVVQAQRLEELFPIDLDAADQPGMPAAADDAQTSTSIALAAAESELEDSPKPDAQLASVVAAPVVSPPARESGETANVEPEPAADPRPEPPRRESPSRQVAAPVAKAAPPEQGEVADTRPAEPKAPEPVLEPEPKAVAVAVAPESSVANAPGPGGLASVGPPVPTRTPATPDDYGPAPAGGAPGPLAVAMSALDFDRFAEPRYPRSRAVRKMRGWVEVQFTVKPDGKTNDVRIVDSSPPEVFDESALDAVGKWRFKPHQVNGEPVEVSSIVRLRFEPR